MNSRRRIIILHGWSIDQQNQEKYQSFITSLQKYSACEVMVLDIPGLDSDLKKAWNLNDYALWLKEKLQGNKNLILIAHSFGGRIALNYLGKNNHQNIQKLVLIASAGLKDGSFMIQIKRQLFKILAKIGQVLTHNHTLKRFLYKLAREKDYLEANPVQKEIIKKTIDVDLSPSCLNIHLPTLIIWGQNDRVLPLKFAYRLNKLIKDSSLKIISEARHSPQFTHPQKTAQIIANFINDD